MSDSLHYRGWRRPGPIPPGGIQPEEGETLSYISGHYRVFQYARGHRFSTDDVLTAWYGTQWAPRVERAADLGSGIGSVALVAAWRLPGARFVTAEAQEESIRLARKSIRYNGLAERFKLLHGDLRDPALFEGDEPFDLVLGSPPYFPLGTASPSHRAQAVGARIEMRGSISDYAETAARILAPGGVFAFVFPTGGTKRAEAALQEEGLILLRRRDVVFQEGENPSISLFATSRAVDLPSSFHGESEGKPVIEPPLVIRRADGTVHPEYATLRLSFGFHPADMIGASESSPSQESAR
ncbi:MAG: methyltransferase [Thermoanaerobaculia bacterium]